MKIGQITAMLLVLALSAGLYGCGGGGAEVVNTNVSKGQELSDLKKALDTGAINQQEYEKLRKQVLER